ncbi:hypothetical protein Patl1_07717 [Pistacia atlantica]|uniref:Uncharacterized protein n=1 Tax=Pistacia atlantica TaxID=434234 RepID=A0ACC1ALP9_9ROSI|nr:hypothetical protein Patl1_07717 [Pistacia atlantica]
MPSVHIILSPVSSSLHKVLMIGRPAPTVASKSNVCRISIEGPSALNTGLTWKLHQQKATKRINKQQDSSKDK